MRRWIVGGALLASAAVMACTANELTARDWQRLRVSLKGTLVRSDSPWSACASDPAGTACADARTRARNPFYLQDQPGGTQSTGWYGAWSAQQSDYVVAAESPADVVAAVRFARQHGLSVAIKGTGHDYLGRSNRAHSLLIWTHKMRAITVHDGFVPRGCSSARAGVPAVTLGAGTRWLEAYREASVKHGRYVQGGGCTTVGAAGGFLQGGGFGSWSKKYGTGAAGMLEAEVVTADGELRIANACQNQDLFWALRGGGGGTFGVVTQVTLMTHPLPATFGILVGTVNAKTDAAFAELLEHFLLFYGEKLNDEHWGEQVRVNGNNSLDLSMTFQGTTAKEAEEAWQPFRTWIEARPGSFSIQVSAIEVPARKLWDRDFLVEHAPQFLSLDERPDAPGGLFWWKSNHEEVATYWYAYQSRWIPVDRFTGEGARSFARTLFAASRRWPVALHFNKGQAGASADAVARGRETAMNPAVYGAAALAIVAASGQGLPGVRGLDPDRAEAEHAKAGVTAAMGLIREATPGAGAYVNEADYFEPDWQRSFWGPHYDRLLAIKRKVDPFGLFSCHHCVGSEAADRRGSP